MSTEFRIEKDSMGELKVPADALYAAKGNVIGSAAERRRGPISPRK